MKSKCFILGLVLLFSLFSSPMVLAEPDSTPSGIPFSDLEGFVDDYMSRYVGVTTPGTAIVVIKDGNIILSKGYGYANIEKGIPVSSNGTVFEWGSVSKLFVYTTIMRLSEQGKIDLNADIRQYLPEGFLRHLRYDEPITMIHIMNHTTGFEDYLFDVILPTDRSALTFEEAITKCQPRQIYRPGTVSAYSNYAVALAAYVAQGMLGTDYGTYLSETVFKPLNMNRTSAYPLLADRPDLKAIKAEGYSAAKNGFVARGWSYVPLYPVGGINGTAEDLARFAAAMMPGNGQSCPLFARDDTLDEFLLETFSMGPGMPGFAHGWIEKMGERRALGHGGNTAYFSAQMNIVPEERFGVILLTNASGEMNITEGLTNALLSKSNETILAGGTLPDAHSVEGTYMQARSMHTGFLELYGYLSLMKAKATAPDTIELNVLGQTATLVETAPYLFRRKSANGVIVENNFNPLYFQVQDGKVARVSGDFVPLKSGRTVPWLMAYAISAAICTLAFLIAPIGLAIAAIRRKRKSIGSLPRYRRPLTFLVLSGFFLVANNGILIVRMLINNYRSFSEVSPHIALNYPLVLAGISMAVMMFFQLKNEKAAGRAKVVSILLAVAFFIVSALLINWQFLNLNV